MSVLLSAEVYEGVILSSVGILLQLLCPYAEILQSSLRVFNICLQTNIYLMKLNRRAKR